MFVSLLCERAGIRINLRLAQSELSIHLLGSNWIWGTYTKATSTIQNQLTYVDQYADDWSSVTVTASCHFIYLLFRYSCLHFNANICILYWLVIVYHLTASSILLHTYIKWALTFTVMDNFSAFPYPAGSQQLQQDLMVDIRQQQQLISHIICLRLIFYTTVYWLCVSVNECGILVQLKSNLHHSLYIPAFY